MKTSILQVRMSTKLKATFAAYCQEREISLSDAARDLISKSVRNYKQGKGKVVNEEEQAA